VRAARRHAKPARSAQRRAARARSVAARRGHRRAPAQEAAGIADPTTDQRFYYGPVRAARKTTTAGTSPVAHATALAAHEPTLGSGWSDLVSEARRWVGTNPTGRRSLWCARFMNFVLERAGHRGTGSDMAQSFARYGRRVPGPQVGAIAVMSRGRRGCHVGVVSGIDANGNPIIISGNHNNRVAEVAYPRGRVFAYVMPGS
jgi:uncharacterized protein (TIGR02594 family)